MNLLAKMALKQVVLRKYNEQCALTVESNCLYLVFVCGNWGPFEQDVFLNVRPSYFIDGNSIVLLRVVINKGILAN